MKETFLNEVNSIIEQNIENENFDVNELVLACNSSRSQLYRKFKEYTKKSTSQYIREYRLERAHDLLVNGNYTSAEIAYKVGFNSPTYFNSSFRRYFGYTPGEAKLRSSFDNTFENGKKANKISKPYRKWSVIGSIIAIAVITIFIILTQSNTLNGNIANVPTNDTLKNKISIAVLPFKNLSDNKENTYFAFGIREDIINKISKIEQVIVKSPHSIEDYIKQGSSLKDIGNKLGVNYLINGSVQKSQDRIKIIINLIETKNDLLKISKSFEGSYKDIFDLEEEISQSIATELNLVITPEQLKLLKQQPTKSLDAYQLYMKGRYFYYLGATDTNELAYNYFLESINLDPEFAMAYVGLADLIDSSYWPRIPDEKYEEMKEYALKAMALDKTIPDPHKILAKIYMKQHHNWDAAEKEFRLALKIDREHEETNIEYGRFLAFVRGDFKQAQKLFLMIEEENPLSLYNLATSADVFLAEGNYREARRQIEKAKEFPMTGLWPGWIYWDSFLIYLLENEPDLAVNELKKGWSYDPEAKNNIEPMMEAYGINSIKGIFEWFIEFDKSKIGPESKDQYKNGMYTAEHYTAIGNQEKALEYLEMGIQNRQVHVYEIKYRPLLIPLRDNPKFIDILKRLNLGDYTDKSFLP